MKWVECKIWKQENKRINNQHKSALHQKQQWILLNSTLLANTSILEQTCEVTEKKFRCTLNSTSEGQC